MLRRWIASGFGLVLLVMVTADEVGEWWGNRPWFRRPK